MFQKEINGFSFVKNLNVKNTDKQLKYALYEDGEGQQALAKMAREHSRKYYWLINETRVYEMFQKIINKNPDIKRNFADIKLLEFYGHCEDAKTYIVLLEYIDFYPISNILLTKRIQILKRIFGFFDEINRCAGSGAYHVRKRNKIHILILFIFISIMVLIKFPRYRKLAIEGILIFIKNIPAYLKYSNNKFIHRDLSNKNISSKNDKICIIDFELSVITDGIFEYINLLIKYWSNADDKKALLDLYKRQKYSEPKDIFRMLSIYGVFYDLLIQPEREKSDIDYLKYLITRI